MIKCDIDGEFTLITEYCNLLAPIYELTTILSGSHYATISIIYPAIYSFVNEIIPGIECETQICLRFQDVLLISLNRRFKYIYDSDLFLAATLLNHSYRRFHFVKDPLK